MLCGMQDKTIRERERKKEDVRGDAPHIFFFLYFLIQLAVHLIDGRAGDHAHGLPPGLTLFFGNAF